MAKLVVAEDVPVHKFLRSERLKAGRKQGEVARAIGMDQGQYCQIELGKNGRRLTLNTAYKIAVFLDIPIGRLVGEGVDIEEESAEDTEAA